MSMVAKSCISLLERLDQDFRNIEGWIKGKTGPELVFVCHHDTIPKSPGANDNASAIAVILEMARILVNVENIGNIHFLSFDLEEGSPVFQLRHRKVARELGLIDEQNRFLNLHTTEIMKKHNEIRKNLLNTTSRKEIWNKATDQLKESLTESELQYVIELEKTYGKISNTEWWGTAGIIGSNFWVQEAIKTKREIQGVVCLDTIGYTSTKPNSQILPKGLDPNYLRLYNTKEDARTGDFIAVIADGNSTEIFQSFCSQCEREPINLPYGGIQVPLNYPQIADHMSELLRSDHAPFWKSNIPGIFLTGTGNFRYPFYHTEADTIDKLDFKILRKICQACIALSIDLTSDK